MDVKHFEQECTTVMQRYRSDVETAHIHEDIVVYDALRELVNAIDNVSDLEELKKTSKEILECIKKMRDHSKDIKWYA